MAQFPSTHNQFALSSEQREEFAERGVLRLPGLLSDDAVRRAREAALEPLARLGLWRDGGWRLDALPRPVYPATGLKTSKAIGNKRPEIEALLEEPALLAAVDALLEGRRFDRNIFKRPQVLFTLPNIDVWRLPEGWHADGPRLASGESPGVQLFACLDHVAPQGGGTMVVAGSHRLMNGEGRFLRARDLTAGPEARAVLPRAVRGPAERGRRLPKRQIGDVTVEVMEITGAPGDV